MGLTINNRVYTVRKRKPRTTETQVEEEKLKCTLTKEKLAQLKEMLKNRPE